MCSSDLSSGRLLSPCSCHGTCTTAGGSKGTSYPCHANASSRPGATRWRTRSHKIGTKAPQAAGKIHTDFERGFIKAEVVNYKDLLKQGSLAAAREKGLVGMEGKDYVVKDGDVILFRFNV